MYQHPAVFNDRVLVQICIRWGIQHGTSVMPKATSDDHVVGNLDVLDWELSSEDYEVKAASMLSYTWFLLSVFALYIRPALEAYEMQMQACYGNACCLC